MASLTFAAGVNPKELTIRSANILIPLLDATRNPGAQITCLGRTPEHQARAMRENCIRYGVDVQKLLYSRDGKPLPGSRVIDVFVASKALSPEDTIAAMTRKIVELGPETVSDHCVDPKVKQAIDLGDRSLVNRDRLITVARAQGFVCLDEARNGCVHIVIPQPAFVGPPAPTR